MVVLRGGAVAYERGAPTGFSTCAGHDAGAGHVDGRDYFTTKPARRYEYLLLNLLEDSNTNIVWLSNLPKDTNMIFVRMNRIIRKEDTSAGHDARARHVDGAAAPLSPKTYRWNVSRKSIFTQNRQSSYKLTILWGS